MIRRHIILPFFICFLFFLVSATCKTTPPPLQEPEPAEEEDLGWALDPEGIPYDIYDYNDESAEADPAFAAPGYDGFSLDEPSFYGEEPELSLPPETPGEGDIAELLEPEYAEASADAVTEPAALVEAPPEDGATELTEALEPDIASGEVPPEEAPPLEETVAAVPATPPEPALPPGPPPEPQRFLRPAEPLPPPQPPREIPSAPIDPPARLPLNAPGLGITPIPARTLEEETYSRTVYALRGQIIEIPYRGTGWVFLGETSAKPGIVYNSRRLEEDGMSFVFRAAETGVYELRFYRQDFIRDYIINDHVQVIVEPALETAVPFGVPEDRVVALPRWPDLAGSSAAGPTPEAAGQAAASTQPGATATQPGLIAQSATPARSGTAAQPGMMPQSGIADEGIVPAGTALLNRPGQESALPPAGPELPPETLPEEYLRRAREESDAGHVQQALAILEQFRSRFPQGSDEAWWLLGQLYEANSPYRNIRLAMDYYRRLIRDYPQSQRYGDARRRIAYLERYYFNIQ